MMQSKLPAANSYALAIQWIDPGNPDDPEPTPVDSGAVEQGDDIFVGRDESDDEERSSARPVNLHPDDPAHFLKLSSALKLLLADEITTAEIEESDRLLREYNLGLLHVGLHCFGVRTCTHISLLVQALRARGHASQPPLLNPRPRMHLRFWSLALFLDLPL